MQQVVMAVFDVKADAYAQPFFVANREIGIRSFTAAVNDPATLLSKFPEDYRLFELGTFDDALGKFVGNLEFICSASQLQQSKVLASEIQAGQVLS